MDTALSLLTGGTDLFYGLIGKIFWWVLIPLGGLVLQLLGLVIDAAVSLSLNPKFYNSEAIGIAWSIVRDLANMLFIFVLIYEGIKTILNIGNLASVKRTIASVIIAALLLNFSLFATKAMIDVSNVATAWFVHGITQLAGGDNTSMSKAVHSTLQMEKLTRSAGGLGTETAFKASTFSLQAFTQGVLLFVLICVAIYVFFQMIFLIVGRIVAFIFLLITAPIGFTGVFLSLGDLSTQAQKWWKEMMQQLMMLPMFFLMLYLTLFLVDRLDTLVFGNDAVSTEFTPANYLIFVIIIMMLLKSLSVAKEYSGEMGGAIAKITKSATSVAFGGLAGVAAYGGRISTRGIIAGLDFKNADGTTASMKDRISAGVATARQTAGSPMPLNLMTKAGWIKGGGLVKGALASGTMDIRNAIPNGDGILKPFQDIAAGKANSSYGLLDQKARKESDKTNKEAWNLQKTEVKLLDDLVQLTRERNELADAERELAMPGGNTPANINIRDAAKAAVQAREDSISAAFQKTSNKDLEKLNAVKILTNKDALNLMSAEEVSHLRDKSELPESVKGKIKVARESELKAAMQPTPAHPAGNTSAMQSALKKLGKNEIETLSDDFLSDANIANLASPDASSYEKFDTLMKSDSIGAGTKNKLRAARYHALKASVDAFRTTGSDINTLLAMPAPALTAELTAAKTMLTKYREPEIAKMGKEILTDPRIALSLTPQALSKIAEELSMVDRAEIRTIIDRANGAHRAFGNTAKLKDWLDSPRGMQF